MFKSPRKAIRHSNAEYSIGNLMGSIIDGGIDMDQS